MALCVETLNGTVERELDALPADMRAQFVRIGHLIFTFGLEQVGAPHVRHLTDPLWEIRLSGKDGKARALCVVRKGQQVFVVRAFMRNAHHTPLREIKVALRRAKEVIQ